MKDNFNINMSELNGKIINNIRVVAIPKSQEKMVAGTYTNSFTLIRGAYCNYTRFCSSSFYLRYFLV